MTRRRRLLVVLYHYPPVSSVGASRWLAQAKYLRRLGHEVTILTTSAFGGLPDDAAAGVVRAYDVVAAPIVRRLLGRSAAPRTGMAVGEEKPAPTAITRLVVPDPTGASWAPWAAAAARRLVRERAIDCVVSSSPPESAHLVGLAAAGSVAWIADFRDGWTFEPMRPRFYTRLQHHLDERLEHRVVTRADRVLAVSRPLVDDFRRRFRVDAMHVPNAWDPELADEPAEDVPDLSRDRVSLVHTGAFTGAWGRDPRPLLQAVASLPEAYAAKLELVLAGPPQEARLVAEHGLAGRARHVGRLPRASALALQRRADVLVLVTSSYSGEATGKLAEYLGAGRPILALAEENEAARVVEDTGTGIAVSPDDPAGIAAALRDAAAGRLAERYAPRALEPYVFPGPAATVAAEVERALEARRARENAVR